MLLLLLQNDIYEWSRDHRVHHKFSETDADPHNARRGFFFAHVGWLLCKKHPQVKERGKTVDMSDLLQDPIVVYQRKYLPETKKDVINRTRLHMAAFSACCYSGSTYRWFCWFRSSCLRGYRGTIGGRILKLPSSWRQFSVTCSR